jgi:glyoxylase-like metal-dependent hydrolase (beta-lactamase superfamily II)
MVAPRGERAGRLPGCTGEMTANLALEVYTVPTQPVVRPPEPPAPPGGWTWPPNTAALVYGERDAVLVDTLVTTTEVTKLADWIGARERNLTTIYLTHDHVDHIAGAAVLLDRFPGARLVALPAVAGSIRAQLATPVVDTYWRPMFHGDIVAELAVPEPLADGRVELEGRELTGAAVEQSDSVHSTYLHIPELDALVVGDIAYNDVHVNIASTDHAKRLAWIDSLRTIGALNPGIVVAGHRRPDAQDTAQTIPDTIAYIADFDDVLSRKLPAADTIAWMLQRHPNRLNITTLYNAAYVLAGQD